MAAMDIVVKAEKPTTAMSHLAPLSTPDLASGAQLTPGFFDSIFNDGMNPFDECFSSQATSHHGTTAQTPSRLRAELRLHVEKDASEQHTYARVNADLEQLRRKQTTPMSPPISPTARLDKPTLSPFVETRSPSPFTFEEPFMQSPRPSTSPITSPEEMGEAKSLKMIKVSYQEEQATERKSAEASLSLIFNDFNPTIQGRRATVQATRANVSHPISHASFDMDLASKVHSFNRSASFSHSGTQLSSPSNYSFTRPHILEAPPQQKSKGGNTQAPKRKSSLAQRSQTSPKIKPEEDTLPVAAFMPINTGLSPQKKRKNSLVQVRKARSVSQETDEDDEDLGDDGGPDSEGKRARFLERNRIAASKCRKKKKLMNARLEEKSRVLQTENRYLNIEKEQLKADICKLKQIVLMHHSCGCDAIQKYLKQEAGKFIELNGEAATCTPSQSENSAFERQSAQAMDIDSTWQMQSKDEKPVFGGEFNSFEDLEDAVLPRSDNSGADLNDDDFAMMFDHMG